jgi:hypothetical protein
MHHLSEAATNLEFYWLGADILVLCITVLFDKALDSHGRRQGYAPVCHGIPMFWEQKQIYIHICIMVLALCMHRVLFLCSRKAACTTNVWAKQQLAQHACRCPASLRGRLLQSCSRNASLAAAEGQGVDGHHSMCAHIHRPKWYSIACWYIGCCVAPLPLLAPLNCTPIRP